MIVGFGWTFWPFIYCPTALQVKAIVEAVIFETETGHFAVVENAMSYICLEKEILDG